MTTILFDINGTLTDPAGLAAPWNRPELGAAMLDAAVHTAMVDAIIGTSERPFIEHIESAIRCLAVEHELDADRVPDALQNAAELPPRPGAEEALERLAGARLVALTNSGAEAGERTLRAARLLDRFEQVLGVDAVGTFKPHRSVYRYALEEARTAPADAILVATHFWDLAGAARLGIGTAWVTHGVRGWPNVFPPPDHRAANLPELAEVLLEVTSV